MAIHEEHRGGMVHVRCIAETREKAEADRRRYEETHPPADFHTLWYETDASIGDRVVIKGWRYRRSADAEAVA